MVWRAVEMVHDEIAHSAYPTIPLIFSEYNASYANEPNVTDSTFMGPWLANNIRLCDGLTQSMDYWAFSDVFEEQGVVRTPFYGGFGLVAADHIPKPALNIFRILHKLGDRRIAVDSDSSLATEIAQGGLAIALWDYAPPTGTGAAYTMPSGPAGPAKTFYLEFKNVAANAVAEVWRVDDDHGNVLKAFDAMGRPPGDLTQDQIARLRAAGEMAPPERMHLDHGSLHIAVPAHGLAVVSSQRGAACIVVKAAVLAQVARALVGPARARTRTAPGALTHDDDSSSTSSSVAAAFTSRNRPARTPARCLIAPNGLTARARWTREGWPASPPRASDCQPFASRTTAATSPPRRSANRSAARCASTATHCPTSTASSPTSTTSRPESLAQQRNLFHRHGASALWRAHRTRALSRRPRDRQLATAIYERVDWPWMLNGE